MSPLGEFRRNLGDVVGWLALREPRAGALVLSVTFTRPPHRRELGCVAVGARASAAGIRLWQAQAESALQALGWRTRRRIWDYVAVESTPPACEISAHQRLDGWRRVEDAMDRPP